MLFAIKSNFIIKQIFLNVNDKRKFNIISYNKKLQNTLKISNIDFRYICSKYKIACENGKGKEYNSYNDNLIFEGEYLNSKRNGLGKEYDKEENLIYEGEYKNGKKTGKGIEYNENGNVIFEGEFLNGIKWNGIIREYDIN